MPGEGRFLDEGNPFAQMRRTWLYTDFLRKG
jgi:hypothetical protein